MASPDVPHATTSFRLSERRQSNTMANYPNYPGPVPLTLSKGPYGTIIIMNVFVEPSNIKAYLKNARPVAEAFHKEPECLFVQFALNPNDPGHLRIVHGWTKDSAWWHEEHLEKPYFQEFIKKSMPLWVKPRVIEHFDRIPADKIDELDL